MSELRIARMRARLDAPAGGDARRRLEAILRALVDDALDRALDRAGVDVARKLVCARELRVPPVTLRLGASDASLAAAWADATAAELARRVASGGPGVVAYASPRQALLDVALGVARGDLRRAWAWTALGLWPVPRSADPGAALVGALLAEPAAIAPVVAAVARAGEALPLAAREWTALARAALEAAGVAPSRARAALSVASGAPGASAAPEALAPARAALALCAATPAAPRALGDALPAALASTEWRTDRRMADASAIRRPGAAPGGDGATPPADRPDAGGAAEDADGPLPERARAATEWGGIAFVLHLLDGLDLPAPEAVPAALHALALALVPAEPTDPAVLLLAGLAPDADPPPPPSRPDPRRRATLDRPRAWVAEAVEVVDGALAERLGVGRAELDRHALLRRRAEIVADPGWLDVHLRLDEVDVAVRRAGLDLDPGFVAVLGCVVTVRYA